MIRTKDIAIWEAAKPFLDVRNNDEHTLYSYTIGQQLLNFDTDANPDIVLPAIILHDTGWKMIPKDKVLQAFGPNRKYPELQRQHELESVQIATKVLNELGNFTEDEIKQINDIIDGHDTRKEALSINDSIMKDSDKLWRYTPHGIQTIARWFNIDNLAVLDILENFVLPDVIRNESKLIANNFLNVAKMKEKIPTYL